MVAVGKNTIHGSNGIIIVFMHPKKNAGHKPPTFQKKTQKSSKISTNNFTRNPKSQSVWPQHFGVLKYCWRSQPISPTVASGWMVDAGISARPWILRLVDLLDHSTTKQHVVSYIYICILSIAHAKKVYSMNILLTNKFELISCNRSKSDVQCVIKETNVPIPQDPCMVY